MDLVKIGKYIAGKRKDLGMTQKQLDDILDPYALTGPELPDEDDLVD